MLLDNPCSISDCSFGSVNTSCHGLLPKLTVSPESVSVTETVSRYSPAVSIWGRL